MNQIWIYIMALIKGINPTIKIEDILNILKKLILIHQLFILIIFQKYSDFNKLLNDVKK